MKDVLSWIGSHERSVLIALLMSFAATWCFVSIADEVIEGDALNVDRTLLLMLRSSDDVTNPVGPAWFEEMARDVTGLGGVGVLTFLTLATAGFLGMQGKWRLAIYLLFAVGVGVTISLALKAGFSRPRPDLVLHGSNVYTSSFPSGHSMMSAVTFLSIGALLAGSQKSLRLKAFVIGLAVLLSLSVGASRVYLGVHWPSDVLGGWTAGAAWALLCWAVAKQLRTRGKVE